MFFGVWRLHIKRLLISLVIPSAAGGLSALLTGGSMKLYGTVRQPPLAPPSLLFPIVWSILYLLMGLSLYLIGESSAGTGEKRIAFTVFGISLFLNFIWSPIFFAARAFLAAFVVLFLLWLAVLGTVVVFYGIRRAAGLLQLPYLLWVGFAAQIVEKIVAASGSIVVQLLGERYPLCFIDKAVKRPVAARQNRPAVRRQSSEKRRKNR